MGMLSFWRNFRHWLSWELWFWKLPVKTVTKIWSKDDFSEWEHVAYVPDCSCFPTPNRLSKIRKMLFQYLGHQNSFIHSFIHSFISWAYSDSTHIVKVCKLYHHQHLFRQSLFTLNNVIYVNKVFFKRLRKGRSFNTCFKGGLHLYFVMR